MSPRAKAASDQARTDRAQIPALKKRVLNVGSGEDRPENEHRVFQNAQWQKIRFDIDPEVKPDHVGSIVELEQKFPTERFDAIFCSHAIEHLFTHEVLPALKGFHKVLKPDAFTLITCPDMETVMAQILQHGLETALYGSEAGPISGLDILFGHTQSIARGKVHMAHKTGFTAARLGNVLMQAGFASVVVDRIGLDLWAVGMREKADQDAIRRDLCAGGLLLTF